MTLLAKPARQRLLLQVVTATALVALLPPARALDVVAHAFPTATPVDYYRNVTQQELVSCGDTVQASSKQSRPLDRGERSCFAVGAHVCRLDFEAAMQIVSKPDARAALRAYHSAFMSALDGIAPQKGEAREVYQRRQQELQHRLAHAWTRFELAE